MNTSFATSLRVPTDPEAECIIISAAAHGQAQAVFNIGHEILDGGLPYRLSRSDFSSERRARQWDVIALAYTTEGEVTALSLVEAFEELFPEASVVGGQYEALNRFENTGAPETEWKIRECLGRIRDAAERRYLAELAHEVLAIVTNPTSTAAEAVALIRSHQAWLSARVQDAAETLGTDLPF